MVSSTKTGDSEEPNWRMNMKRRSQPIAHHPAEKRFAVSGNGGRFTTVIHKVQPSSSATENWTLRMPESHHYACSAIINDAYQGWCHMYIRHYPQYEAVIPGLRQLRWRLPNDMKTLLESIKKAVNMEEAKDDVAAIKKYITTESTTLKEIQRLIWAFFQTVVTTKTATHVFKDGSRMLHYKLDNTSQNLVIVVSNKLESPLRFDKRRVRRIITAYLAY